MILGDICTRACRYCAVNSGRPEGLDKEEPANLLLKWNRTNDIDTDIELNKNDLYELYYRIELLDIEDSLIFVLADSINDFVYENGTFCDELFEITDTTFDCNTYSYLTDSNYAFYSIELNDSFPSYSSDITYNEAELTNQVLNIKGEIEYIWRIVAQNYELDQLDNDPAQIISALEEQSQLSNPFFNAARIPLTL